MLTPTHELIEQICSIVRIGLDFRTACLSHSIDSDTVKEWEKKLESGKSEIWAEFKRRLEFAEAQCRTILIQRILAEGGGNGARFIFQNIVNKPETESTEIADSYSWMKGTKGKK